MEGKDTTRCPQCARSIPMDRRYVTWCDGCDWNVEPDPDPDPMPAWRRRVEHRLTDALYRELEFSSIRRPGWDLARVAAYALSLLVLLLPIGCLAIGVYALTAFRPVWVAVLIAATAFAAVWLFRPRPFHLDDDQATVSRDEAPRLYALLDRIADALGTERVRTVVADVEANAWYTQVGWRRPGRRHRAAVLDELTATFSEQPLDEIRHELSTQPGAGDQEAYVSLVTRTVNATVGRLVRGYGWLLERTELCGSQRADYLADRMSAEIAGSDAAAGQLDHLVLAASADRALEKALRFDRDAEPLAAVRRTVAEIPPREVERRLRASASGKPGPTAHIHPPTCGRS